MFAKQYGDGPQLYVALHGWAGDHRDFAPLAGRRPEGVRILSVDLPGHGASPPPAQWTADAIADEVHAALRQCIADAPRTYIGFCSGNLFALLLAERDPASAQRIVMIDPFAYVPWYFRIFTAGGFGRYAYAITFRWPIGRAITNRAVRRAQHSDADFTRAFTEHDHETTLRYLRLLNNADVHRFANIRAPIDILYGQNTFSAVRKSVDILRRLWPHARAIELPGVGHLPMVQGARPLAEAIFAAAAQPC